MSDAAPIEDPTRLTSGDPFAAEEPIALLLSWLNEATRSEPVDPNAMALATVDAEGMPNVRMVLLKDLDLRGLVFYTNTDSQKGRELAASRKAAVAFHWKSLARQVRVRGLVERVDNAEADAYFATRPRLTQIGAWASQQSAPLASRAAFAQAVAVLTAKYALGPVPRPPYWTGFRIAPLAVEFWRDRPFRLHERVAFVRAAQTEPWTKMLLYP